jgi:hypothetical protein
MLETYRTIVRHFNATDVLGTGTTHQNRTDGIGLSLKSNHIEITRRLNGQYWGVTVRSDGSIEGTERTPAEFVERIKEVATA